MDAMKKIVGKIDNPRYIIVRKSLFIRMLSQKDYHAVPDVLGRNKKYAAEFFKQWKYFVGRADIVYTRNIEGRKLLLQAKMNALSSALDDKSERINLWR